MAWRVVVLLVAWLGHTALCLQLSNHLHALPFPRWFIKLFAPVIHLANLLGPAWVLWHMAMVPRSAAAGAGQLPFVLRSVRDWASAPTADFNAWPLGVRLYLGLVFLFGLTTLGSWFWRRFVRRPPVQLLSLTSRRLHLWQELPPEERSAGIGAFCGRLPRNEAWQLDIGTRELGLSRLPLDLDRLTIAHLSDLHFTGRVGRAYFQRVVDETNALQPDLVVISGDLIDRTACLDWIEPVLGRLQGRYGSFFVLGNHDLKVDHRRLRRLLTDCGLFDLAQGAYDLALAGHTVRLWGNERPWFALEPGAATAAEAMAPSASSPATSATARIPAAHSAGSSPACQIVVAHTPDQFGWARRLGADLMLAGHTHGGQIQLPWIGPILAPSHYGVRYCAGTFYSHPTILHVSRGLSGMEPLRWNCPPELALLVLRHLPEVA